MPSSGSMNIIIAVKLLQPSGGLPCLGRAITDSPMCRVDLEQSRGNDCGGQDCERPSIIASTSHKMGPQCALSLLVHGNEVELWAGVLLGPLS